MLAVPTDTPVTTPLPETYATDVLLLLHVPPVGLAVRVVVDVPHIIFVPPMDGVVCIVITALA